MGCIHGVDVSSNNNEEDEIEFDNAFVNISSAKDKARSESPKQENVGDKKPNPEDLIFIDRNNETLVKSSESINNEAFMIDGCNNCNIYICDISAQIMIDYCKQCNIFIAP